MRYGMASAVRDAQGAAAFERLFLGERRRTKIIPLAFGERPVLKPMCAAVVRVADRRRGLTVGEFEQRQLREPCLAESPRTSLALALACPAHEPSWSSGAASRA